MCTFLLPALCSAAPTRLYVAPGGNDQNSGRQARSPGKSGPFATPQRARDEVRRIIASGKMPVGGVVVDFAPGVYRLQNPFALTSSDSGLSTAPIVYRSTGPHAAVLRGGLTVPALSQVTDTRALARLPEEARRKVLCADLSALGLKDFGSPAGGGLEVFFDSKPMTLARWPNTGFTKIVDVVSSVPIDVRGTKGDAGGVFVYDGDRPSRWIGEKDLWLHGYWFWDWSDQRMKVSAINETSRTITLAPPQHSYGYRKGQWYYAFNALSELDSPGEWYVDRDNAMLYFWPPVTGGKHETLVSVLPTLLTTSNVLNVTFDGFLLEAARADAITVANGSRVSIRNCEIRNAAGSAVTVNGGTSHTVSHCEIYAMGAGGIHLNGGDRATLTPAGLVAADNHIHHYGRVRRMYTPAVSVTGVGNIIRNNLIHDAPHQAISFGGNDHVIELNEIHDVCLESNDAGAIYSGRDWTMRGTVLRWNYLHDIRGFENRGCMGIYLDDMYCGTSIIGNLFKNVTQAAFIGGGRDNVVQGNIFIDCNPAVHVDARALGWAKGQSDAWVAEAKEKGTASGMAYTKPPYSTRYPDLPGILNNDPGAPRGNRIVGNICVGGKWDDIEASARPLVTMTDDFIGPDPGFVNAAKGNFRLKPSSPPAKAGFKPIPFEEIGPQKQR